MCHILRNTLNRWRSLARKNSRKFTGSEIQSVESQMGINSDTRLRLQSMLSTEEDLDYAEAITRFNQEMTRLEATQTSFAKVSQLSLFDYL